MLRSKSRPVLYFLLAVFAGFLINATLSWAQQGFPAVKWYNNGTLIPTTGASFGVNFLGGASYNAGTKQIDVTAGGSGSVTSLSATSPAVITPDPTTTTGTISIASNPGFTGTPTATVAFDKAAAGTLGFGTVTATAVSIGGSGINTTFGGAGLFGGNVDRSSAATLALGTVNASALTLGSASIVNTVPGDLVCNGNTTIGNASTDTFTFNAASIAMSKEVNHDITIAASTTISTAGGDLTEAAGVGSNGSGSTAAAAGGLGKLAGGAGGTASSSSTGAGGVGGNAQLISGAGGAAAGGSGAAGNSGAITVASGTGGAGTATGVAGKSGNVNILTGSAGANGGAGGNNSGNVLIDVGAPSGAGATGSISIGTGANLPTAITIGAAGSATALKGVVSITEAALLVSSTAPTISSGFGTGASITVNNGTAAFRVGVGTTSGNTGVIGLPTATTGWNCYCTDITTNSSTVFMCKQTASSTTSATVGNFKTDATAAAWVDNDVLAVSCFAY